MMEWTKCGAIGHALNQATHHRAQLGFYYRLSGIELRQAMDHRPIQSVNLSKF
ncbi:MAG: hypothetical protein ACRC0E_08770 [Soonwooa sp.]